MFNYILLPSVGQEIFQVSENIFDADSFYEQPRVSLILMLSVTVSAKQLDDLSFDHCGSTFFV